MKHNTLSTVIAHLSTDASARIDYYGAFFLTHTDGTIVGASAIDEDFDLLAYAGNVGGEDYDIYRNDVGLTVVVRHDDIEPTAEDVAEYMGLYL